MLTILTVPKPFRDHIGDIQRNAIESWLALGSDIQVVLVGDEDGVERAARDAGVQHVGGLERNDRGTPRLDSAFGRAATVAEWPLWCYVNADVLLLDDFPPAVERAAHTFSEFLLIGECRDLDVAAGTRLSDPAVRSQLRELALDRGRLRGYAALDYFVFREGLFDPVPPFLIGRACFDNWLVWRARERGRPVIDMTRSIVAIHQSHDYSHVPGGLDEAYYGDEARFNEQLAGGREKIYSLHDATHRLYARGRPVPYWGSVFRAREKARDAKVRTDIRMAARSRRNLEPIRLLGVFPRPRAGTTPFLDALAESGDVDLTVLYAAKAPAAEDLPEPPRHAHWFPRSVRVSRIDRAVGGEYPINWAILKSFHALRPDCMLIAGWSTFATQAAIAWCLARRVPYLLLVDEDGRFSRDDRTGGWPRLLVDAVARRAVVALVPGPAAGISTIGPGMLGERDRNLPEEADAAAACLRGLARAAREQRRSVVHRVYKALPTLTQSFTRRARRRRTRSVCLGPHR